MRYAYTTSNKLLLFLIIFFIALMSASVSHAENYTFVEKWGSHGSGNGQFVYPRGIAVDSSGNIFVSDSSNHRIQKFNSNGAFLTKWGSFGTDNGQFNYPQDIAVDSSNNVYVADTYNNRIQTFDSNGNFITQWGFYGTGDGQLSIPVWIAVDSSSNVYIMDLAASKSSGGICYPRVQKFSSNGTFISRLGSKGSGDGQFNTPNGIAVDSSDNVYIVDSGYNRIQKFDSNGAFLTKWGSFGTVNGQFDYPYGIAVDSLDNIYVADYQNHRIQKFDNNGTFITKWGSEGIDEGQFRYPYDVAVDPLDNVYVTDQENNRIQKFSIEKSVPTITWDNPADIVYEMPLTRIQLNATSSIPGNFTYYPPEGSILPVGSYPLYAYFTPIDTTNYTLASKNVTINVSEKLLFPSANFSSNITSGYAPLSVQIAGILENATGINWNFGDGNNNLTNFTLEHLFSIPGTYNISVNTTNENGTSPKVVTINVLKPPVLPVVNFKSNVSQGYAPLTVQFTDLSTNATERNWNFGDGTNSTEKNPMHTFYTAGNYTVNLTVANEDSNNSGFSTIIVLQKPNSIWEYSPKEPVCGDALNINGSTSPGEIINASVTFEKTVPVSEGRFEYVFENVTIPKGLDNLFTVEARGVNNLNVGIKMLIWVTKSSEALGDTATISQSNVPQGSYTVKVDGDAGEGISEVKLKLTAFQGIKADSNGNFNYSYSTTGVPPGNFEVKIGDITKEITLKPKELEQPSLVLPVANFSTNISKGNTPLSVEFKDLSQNSDGWYWNFGDGTNSTEQNPIHKYSKVGNYTVALTVNNSAGSNKVTKQDYIIASNPVTYDEPYAFVMKWGSYGSNDGQFYYPIGVAVDSSNNVYVIDDGNNRIQKFDSNGVFITKWGSLGSNDGQLGGPEGIAVDSSGNLYLVEKWNNRIQKFDCNGSYLSKWGSQGSGDGQFYYPIGIAIDPSDNVYVIDDVNHRIQKFDSNGNFITKWGSSGTGDGQLGGPEGIAVDSSGNVYVVEKWNNRIQEFDSNGNFITKWGSYGSNDGQFYYPIGVAVDSSNNVYVIDDGNNRIQKFDSNGVFITKWGSLGSNDGQLGGPEGIAVDSSGNVYVVEKWNNRIQKFSSKSLPIANFSSNFTSGSTTLNVQFTDLSKDANKWYWNFGDGANSTDQNPMHTYSAAGNYTVNLTAINGNGTNSKIATITVLEKPMPILPIANFTANITEGTKPLTVNFTDRSSGKPTEWEWSFGNGNTSTEQNPVNMFSNEGIYNVTLIASNGNGSSTKESMRIKVNPLPVRPVASFIAALNIPIKFTDTSSNSPTRWYWNFGDGTNSTEQNPVHVFSSDGIYNVTMVATNAAGSSYVKSMNIKENHTLIPPVANFTAKQTGKLQVQFNDTSLNEVLERNWTFGDSSTSTDTNPTHIYDAAGIYIVNLTSGNADGVDTISKTIDVNGTFLGPLKANFTAVPKTGRAPLTVNFTDKSVNATSITWRFGDKKAMSNESNPSYVYEKAGVYVVQLTATNGNVSDIKVQDIIVTI